METKIKFTLEGYNVWGFKKLGFHDYKTNEEREFATKERTGVLMELSTKSFPKGDGTFAEFPCAIVRDDSDGSEYTISPDNLQYI